MQKPVLLACQDTLMERHLTQLWYSLSFSRPVTEVKIKTQKQAMINVFVTACFNPICLLVKALRT